jgi:hypothetical protein
MTTHLQHLELRIDVDAPVEETFAGAVDWAGQGSGCSARPCGRGAGRSGVGARIEAWTGVGPLGFLDTMEITRWEPPRSCHVLHTGKVVKGTGAVRRRAARARPVDVRVERGARAAARRARPCSAGRW